MKADESRMEIRQLRYFSAIYKCGNITKAAKEIHVSQQALSKQMKDFEEELGVTLFVRSVHGVEPTKYAQTLLSFAEQIAATADQALAAVQKMQQEETVSVRLGYVKGAFNFHSALPPRTIFEWENKFPQMMLEIHEYNPDELERMLLQEELELVCTLNGDENPSLCKILFSVEPAYILMSQDNPLAGCRTLTLEDLAAQSFLISRADPMPEESRLQLESFLGFPPHFRVYNGVFEQGIEHVRANEGILFSGQSYCLSRSLDGLAAFPFPNGEAVFRHYLAYKKGIKLSEPVQYFIRKFLAALGPSQ